MNNPTYELDSRSQETAAMNTRPARACTDSSSRLTILGRNGRDTLEVYEEVEEPIHEDEHDFEAQQSHALPYAVHAYTDEVPLRDASKPVVFKKLNNSGAGRGNDQASIGGGSGEHLNKTKPLIPLKPPVKVNTVHAKLQLDTDTRNYSALDKKTRYASLEPHTGEGTGVSGDVMMGESYNYLNH